MTTCAVLFVRNGFMSEEYVLSVESGRSERGNLNFSTHLPTAIGRLKLRRLVDRCVLKIGSLCLAVGLCQLLSVNES